MTEYVEPHHVAEGEAARLGATHQLAVELVDLFDGVAVVDGGLEGEQHFADTDAVADEVRRIAADDDALAERVVAKLCGLFDNRRVGVLAGDDLQKVHPARRIKEVQADEAFARVFVQALRDLADRDPGRIRREDRCVLRGSCDLREQALLDVETLDDGLDDEIRLRDGVL